jgi:hypothetical protein
MKQSEPSACEGNGFSEDCFRKLSVRLTNRSRSSRQNPGKIVSSAQEKSKVRFRSQCNTPSISTMSEHAVNGAEGLIGTRRGVSRLEGRRLRLSVSLESRGKLVHDKLERLRIGASITTGAGGGASDASGFDSIGRSACHCPTCSSTPAEGLSACEPRQEDLIKAAMDAREGKSLRCFQLD